jgi:hypothetical protein
MNAINRLGAKIDQDMPIDQLTAAEAMSEAFGHIEALAKENQKLASALQAIIVDDQLRGMATNQTGQTLSYLRGPAARIAMEALSGTVHGYP